MATWTQADAEQHFFVYVEDGGAADLLYPLGGALAGKLQVQSLVTTLHDNLKSTALAASVPYYTAFVGTSNGRAAAIEELLRSGDKAAFAPAVSLLKNVAAPVAQTFDALEMLHRAPQAAGPLQALLRQASTMTWASFETFAADLFRLLLVSDVKFLRAIDLVQTQKNPWQLAPKKLLAKVEAELLNAPGASIAAVVDAFGIPNMSLGFARHFFGVLFPADATLKTRLGTPLNIPSARRHLLVHRAGIVDREYLDQSKETVPLGSRINVTPQDLRNAFRAVVDAAESLALAADKSL